MVIVCEDCGARFRLNPALLKGAKAARVRCRRCGGYIVVSLPGEPPVPPAPVPIEKEAVSPEDSAPAPRDQEEEEPGLPSPAGEPPALEEPSERSFPSLEEAPLFLPVADPSPPDPLPFEPEPAPFDADISHAVRSEPEPPTPGENAVDSDYEWIEQDPESASSMTEAGPRVAPPPVPLAEEGVSKQDAAVAPRDQEEEPGLPSPAGEPPALEKPMEMSFPPLEEAPLFLPVADASPPEPSEKSVDSDYEWIEQDSESASSPTDAGRQTVPAPWDVDSIAAREDAGPDRYPLPPPFLTGEEVVSKGVPAPGPGDQKHEPTLPLAGEPPALDTQPEESVPPLEEAPLFPPVAEPLPPEPTPFEPEPPPFDADISHAVRSETEAETSTGTGQEPKPYVPLVGEPEPAPATPELKPAAETEAPGPERRHPSRRPPSMLPVLFMSIAWVLLLAAGALYFGTTKQGQETLGRLFAGWGWGSAESAPVGPVYDIRDVKWYADKRSDGLSLFVIKGSVANVGSVPSAGILIRATLLDNDNAALAETAAFAGNPIDEASLRRMDRAGIEGVLTNRYGEGNLNREIPEGKTLPFVVVFMNYPEKAESFLVKAIDAK